MNERTHLDLFTGLAGFSLAARANGVRTIAQCESEEWLAQGLERIWKVPVHRDARKLDATPYRGVWLLTAGVPCQPASRAGEQRGASDDRWLWPQAVRIAQESQPAWLLFENPPGILDVGLDGILADLERVGYEVQPISIPACAVDSPQDRERIWIMGHRKQLGLSRSRDGIQHEATAGNGETNRPINAVKESLGYRKEERCRFNKSISYCRQETHNGGASSNSASVEGSFMGSRPSRGQSMLRSAPGQPWSDYQWLLCPDGKGGTVVRRAPTGLYELADVVSARIPRKFRAKLIGALGNSIVWPVAAEIIAAIIQAENL